MKVYIVKDMFTGTFDDGEVSIDSVWLDEKIAHAVANSRYCHSVEDYEVGEELPEYARKEYEKIKKTGKLN